MYDNVRIFSGSSNPLLTEQICAHLGHPIGKVKLSRFKNGEIYANYEEGLRNHDVYIVQSFSYPVNEHFIELLIMIDAAKRASAKTINLVIPYFGYARQDRKTAPREPISAKMVSDILSKVGANRIITLDLHSPPIQGFFDIPVDHLTALDLINDYIRSKNIYRPVIVSPDAGRAEVAEKLANSLDCSFAIMIKKRPAHNKSIITHIIGEVEDCTPIIIEDLIDTGSTIINVVNGLRQRGAKKAYVCATHPVFSGDALKILNHEDIEEVLVTDSIALPSQPPYWLKSVSVSRLLAEVIQTNICGGSISKLIKIKSV